MDGFLGAGHTVLIKLQLVSFTVIIVVVVVFVFGEFSSMQWF